MFLKAIILFFFLPLSAFSKVYICSDINILGYHLQGSFDSSKAYDLELKITGFSCSKTNCQYKVNGKVRNENGELLSNKSDLRAKNHRNFDESAIATLTSRIFSTQKIQLNLKEIDNKTWLNIYYISNGEMDLRSETECQVYH
jgi:hypothetical protein